MEQLHTISVGENQYAVIAVDPVTRSARWIKPESGKSFYKSRQLAAWHKSREKKQSEIQALTEE